MACWMTVACKEHASRAKRESIIQVCHGKQGPLAKMAAGDRIVVYSPRLKFDEKMPCKKFTAIGTIQPGEPYLFQMTEEFIPWRRRVHYSKSADAPIEPLIDQLTFIKNKERWGFPFRRGCFAIPEADFLLIAKAMETELA